MIHPVSNTPLDAIDVSDPALFQTDTWHGAFERLRVEAPLHFTADSPRGPYWSVSSYDLIMNVELDHKRFSTRADLGGIQLNNIAPNLDRPAFISMDPPEHKPRRRAVAPITNRTSLKDYEDLIRERTVRILEALPRGETFDWVQKVSIDLVSMMLATMFNYAQERRGELMYWSDVAITNLAAPDPGSKQRKSAMRCSRTWRMPLNRFGGNEKAVKAGLIS